MLDAPARSAILQRIDRLKPDQAPLWGRLTAPKMVAHVSDQLRMAMGEIASAPQSRVLSVRPAAWLMIYVIPWPHGAKGPRESFTTSPAEWQHDVEALKVLVDRLPQWEPPGDWPVHPLFGPLTRRDWGAVSYKHFDHHLRQFAV